ncbi:hypothetical protein F511_37953 [Dorcoceras hygrometricum]|uniref:Uncharacterized protein n=1 Tax=Dorcoceras hygrometricum TaxID=472368 RepID=A0A2Z7BQ07_9LAMI|nr:hypothetical protein F511_37953 [Dorcoceras hygrometricum]
MGEASGDRAPTRGAILIFWPATNVRSCAAQRRGRRQLSAAPCATIARPLCATQRPHPAAMHGQRAWLPRAHVRAVGERGPPHAAAAGGHPSLGSDTTVGEPWRIRITPPGEAAEEQNNCRETINTVSIQQIYDIHRAFRLLPFWKLVPGSDQFLEETGTSRIGYPRMSASGESSITMHRLLHASGSHPIPPPDDPKTNKYNQDLGLIHSTNGNHLESPKGSSIDHQVTIYLHAQNITMFPTNETWYFTSQILVSSLGGTSATQEDDMSFAITDRAIEDPERLVASQEIAQSQIKMTSIYLVIQISVFQKWIQSYQSTSDLRLSEVFDSDLGTVYFKKLQKLQILSYLYVFSCDSFEYTINDEITNYFQGERTVLTERAFRHKERTVSNAIICLNWKESMITIESYMPGIKETTSELFWYGPFNPYIPIRSTTIGESRVAVDPIAMHTSWRSNSDIASVTSIGYPRISASGESSTTMHRLIHASGSHPIPTPYDPK